MQETFKKHLNLFYFQIILQNNELSQRFVLKEVKFSWKFLTLVVIILSGYRWNNYCCRKPLKDTFLNIALGWRNVYSCDYLTCNSFQASMLSYIESL